MPEINITDVVQEFGARYTPEGQSAKDIKTKLFSPSETENYFAMRPNQGDYFKSTFATVDEVTQSFSIPFVKKGTLTFKAWETKLGEFKVDQLFTPDRFRNSWLGFLVQIAEADRSKWPILMWYIVNMLLPKIGEEMEEEIAFYGWQKTGYNADPMTRTVNGTTFVREFASEESVTPANAAMDGIKVLIAKMVAANRANVINTGAHPIAPVDFVTSIETFVAQIEPNLRRKMDFLFMSEDLKNKYKAGRREKYNQYYAQESELLAIDNSNMKIQDLNSMGGSQKIWCSPAQNRVRPVDVDKAGRFDIQKVDRSVKILNDWKKGLAFEVPEFVVTNDLENTITAADITARY